MRLIRRKPKKVAACGKLELERVIGLTTTTANGLACNTASDELAYLAGCVVVVFNAKTNSQTHFLTAPRSPKAFACVAYSAHGGKFIAAGESGHEPAVVIWEVATEKFIADLKAHKYRVSCVQFSPNGKHLVSLGAPHDGNMCLWDWKNKSLLMKTRAAISPSAASALQFSTEGTFFVTGGSKHLKHWTIGGPRDRLSGVNIDSGMDGKPIKLGSQKDSSFICIASPPIRKEPCTGAPVHQPIYALTSAGVLCLLHHGLAIKKWVDLQVRQAYALTVSEDHVVCACSDGIVRTFKQDTLEYIAMLPQPAPHGYHGLTDANVSAYLAVGHRVTSGVKFPDAIACSFLQQGKNLVNILCVSHVVFLSASKTWQFWIATVIYSDHSLYVWDVRSHSKIERKCTFLFHNSCIWDVAIMPEPSQASNKKSSLPKGSFATCSADGTIRLWHLDLGLNMESGVLTIPTLSTTNDRPVNVYNKDILGVLYIDCVGEQNERLSDSKTVGKIVDTRVGFRSICISPHGNHLASGDSSGNLRIYDLESLRLHSFQEAHDAEILSLHFTSVVVAEDNLVDTNSLTVALLASGGRDRLVHIYDVNKGYDVIQTLDDHIASITKVKFTCNGPKLLSCSADKSVVFWNVAKTAAGCKASCYHREIASRGTIYDMDTDPFDDHVITVGQEKKLNVLSLATGKPVRCFKPDCDAGEPIKVRMDPSGMYIVCSHSDKCLRVYNAVTGELSAQASGHAEVITGMAFLPDCRRLISVSGDSCIFVWRLPVLLSRAMRKRCSSIAEFRQPLKTLKSVGPRSSINGLPRAAKMARVCQLQEGEVIEGQSVFSAPPECSKNERPIEGDENKVAVDNQSVTQTPYSEVAVDETPAAFKFSVSRLPPWAQAKLRLEKPNSSGGKRQPSVKGNVNHSFESRWAERLGREGYKLFSEFMEEVTPPANMRASRFVANRRDGVADNLDSDPESATVYHQSRFMSTEQIRKERLWTAVHNVITHDPEHDDSQNSIPHESNQVIDADQVEVFRESMPPRVWGKNQGKQDGEDLDHVEVGRSDEETEVLKEEDMMFYTPGSHMKRRVGEDVAFDVLSKMKNDTMDNSTKRVGGSHCNGQNLMLGFGNDKLSGESEDDDGVDDDVFSSPCRDLFSAHFDKLATELKPRGSTRSSFSARYFARSNSQLSRLALFQSSPGSTVSISTNTRALLLDNLDTATTGGQSLVDGQKRHCEPQTQQEDHITEVAEMQQTITKNRFVKAFRTFDEANGARKSGINESCSVLQCSESPQTPDLLFSRSPQLTQERKGAQLPRFQSGSPVPFAFSAKKTMLALPVLEGTESNSLKLSGWAICDKVRQISVPDGTKSETTMHAHDNLGVMSGSCLPSSSQHPVAATKLGESGTTTEVLNTLLDIVPKQDPQPFGTHHLEVGKACDFREDNEVEVFVSATEGSFQPSQLLPRLAEEYEKALEELINAAKKATELFSEVQFSCQRSSLLEPTSSSTMSASLPPDVLLAGHIYQRLVPESLQLVQRLSDKVSTSVFSPDYSVTGKPHGAKLCTFPLQQRSNNFGDNGPQSWPRTSAASFDSLISSVNVESFISRYSQTLANEVLALLQKSLPSQPSE